jgi:hypothetical protein
VLPRVAAVAIVLFWLVMTGLLVRMECFPGKSDLLPVPVDHLFKLMFLHEQPSDLVLFQDQDRIGNLHLIPHRYPASAGAARNSLALTGEMILNLPGFETRYLTLRGHFELDDQDTTRSFELTATIHDPTPNLPRQPKGAAARKNPPNLIIVFDGEPAKSRYHYQVRYGESIQAEESGAPAALLDRPELRAMGIEPAVLSTVFAQQAAATQATARRGILHTKGDDIDTYDVTIRQSDAMEMTVQLSQLGQVMAVQTSAGYSLLDESLAP